jgi:hypothetical protein
MRRVLAEGGEQGKGGPEMQNLQNNPMHQKIAVICQ